MPTVLIAGENDETLLRRALRDGEIARLRRGAFVTTSPDDDGRHPAHGARMRAIARCEAVHRQLRSPHVFCHESAALLRGCPLWETPDRVHVVQDYGATAASARDIARHRVTLPDDDVTTLSGLPVTTLLRTTTDCTTSLHPLPALVVADWALRVGLDRDEALAALARRGDRRGTRRARAVLELADAGAESAWESWLRYVLLQAGFPAPRTQVPIATHLGTFRGDLGWEEWNLVLEFDGFVKYQDGVLGARYDAAQARLAEKRREDAIRERGVRLVRVTSHDRPGEVVQRVLRLVPEPVRSTLRPHAILPPPDLGMRHRVR